MAAVMFRMMLGSSGGKSCKFKITDVGAFMI